MAAPMPMVLVETVNKIYQHFGFGDSPSDKNVIFQEPRICRQDPKRCDLSFTLIPFGGCEASITAAVLFPEYRSFKLNVDIDKVLEELPFKSKFWTLPFTSCKTTQNSLCICLDREPAFRKTISTILSEDETREKSGCRNELICITKDESLDDKEDVDLTQLRTLLAFQSLCNLYRLLGYNVMQTKCSDDQNCSNIKKFHVCYKQLCPEKHSDYSLIHCGAVLDKTTGMKANTIHAKDYYRNKKVALEEVAQGRDGPEDDIDHSTSLSEAEVVGELLWVKLHNSVSLNFSEDPDEAAVSRGATFLLYNHVRLACIRKKFDQEVKSGNYQKLPNVDAVDFGLLTQSEEWELLLLILQFPSWVVNCVSPRGKVSLHPLLIGLDKLCRNFSVYYRRVRILTEPRPQLLPVMHARLYLLLCVERVLGMGLAIFNMKPLNYM